MWDKEYLLLSTVITGTVGLRSVCDTTELPVQLDIVGRVMTGLYLYYLQDCYPNAILNVFCVCACVCACVVPPFLFPCVLFNKRYINASVASLRIPRASVVRLALYFP